MKVYSGTRVFDRDSMSHEGSVVVQSVGDDWLSERRPLTHVAYHSPDGFEWGYAGSDESARETVRNLYRSIGRFIYSMTKAANPSLTDRRIRQIVLQLFSLEEGAKLFIGLGPDDDPALRTAERDIRALAQRLLTEG
jgi:hypothetical protein